jgi:hypothetical protein
MTADNEKSPNSKRDLSPTNYYGVARLNRWRRETVTGLVLVCGALSFLSLCHFGITFNHEAQKTADPLSETSYSHLSGHCESVASISHSEFLSRQVELAKTLHDLGASAYIAESGANTQFFGNFSKAQWSLSERPLLLIIAPGILESQVAEIRPLVTVLTPKVSKHKPCISIQS